MKSNVHIQKHLGLLLIIVALIGISFLCSCNPDEPIDPAYGEEVNKDLLLELVNTYRKDGCRCGSDFFSPTTPVVWNIILEQVARDHSNDMFSKKFFDHTGSDGSNTGDRMDRRSYRWLTYGENIAKGSFTNKSVVQAWMNSTGHCKNIMDPRFREMGVAKVGEYWTQVFGSK